MYTRNLFMTINSESKDAQCMIPLSHLQLPSCSRLFRPQVSFIIVVTQPSASGFQATHIGRGAQIIEKMLRWRLKHDALTPEEEIEDPNEEIAPGVKLFTWADPHIRERTRVTVFLSFTSNMISSGLREAFVYLAKHKLVDVSCHNPRA